MTETFKLTTATSATRGHAPDSPVVLHVRVVTGAGGGPDKTIIRSAAYGPAAGLRVAAAYVHPADDPGIAGLQRSARENDCPFHSIPETGPVDLHTARHLLHLCRQLHVAVWHGHDYKSNFLGLLIRRLWPMRLLTTAHGWTGETARTRLYQRLDRLCLGRFDHVITVSRPLLAECRSLGISDSRLTYLPNGIDLEDYARSQTPAAARSNLGVGQDRLILGVVGRLSAEKGVDRAIQLLAAVLPKFPHAELHVIGEGPELESLQSLARTLGVDGAVRFWGWQRQTKAFYEMMDLLLLPSHTEGMPNVVLEAMAMGVPIAATKVGGVVELLDEGRCGVLLSRDTRKWADQAGLLLGSAAMRERAARRGRRRVEAQFSFARRAEAEIEVYRDLLSLPGGVQRIAA